MGTIVRGKTRQMLEAMTQHSLGGGVLMAIVKTEEEENRRRKFMAFGKALDEFRRLNPSMPVTQIQAFLMVVVDENDMSMSEFAKRSNLKISTTSRYLLDLGTPRHSEDTAYDLIVRGVDPTEPRRARYSLSRKGKALANRLSDILKDDC